MTRFFPFTVPAPVITGLSPASGPAGTQVHGTVTFKYDPFGRRLQNGSSASTTIYLYDGSNSAEEIDSTGALLARYARGATIDEPLVAVRGGTVTSYEQDGLGSVTSLSGSVAFTRWGTINRTHR